MTNISLKMVIAFAAVAFLTGSGITSLVQNMKEETPSDNPLSTDFFSNLPTFVPTPTAPQVTGDSISPGTTQDPIIDCGPFKNGETVRVKKSECKNWVSCQIGDKWIPSTRKQCDSAHEELENKIKDFFGNGGSGKSQNPSNSSGTNYTSYYNNTLRYFNDIENCYNKAVGEVKATDVPAMTATVSQCQEMARSARKEIDKLYYAPHLARVFSNLGSAWGWYEDVLNGMWVLGVEIAEPPYDISNSLKSKDAAMSTAKSYADSAKKEWEVTNK